MNAHPAIVSPAHTTVVRFYSLLGRNATSIAAARRIALDVYRNDWGYGTAHITCEKLPTSRNPNGAFYIAHGIGRAKVVERVVFKRCEMLIEE